MLNDFPKALPGIVQLALIVDESQLIASDRLDRLPVDDRLTEDEAMAVAAFTFDLGCSSEHEGEDNLYKQLNNCLRERNARSMALVKPYLSFLLRAVAKSPMFKGVVYRGIPAENSFVVLEKYMKGTMVHWSDFTSTYTDIAAAKQFAHAPGGIIFRIDAINGRCLSSYSFSRREDEILLSPSSFVVTAEIQIDEDGYVILDMMEVNQRREIVSSDNGAGDNMI